MCFAFLLCSENLPTSCVGKKIKMLIRQRDYCTMDCCSKGEMLTHTD